VENEGNWEKCAMFTEKCARNVAVRL